MPDAPDNNQEFFDNPIGLEIMERVAEYERKHKQDDGLINTETWGEFITEYYEPMGGRDAVSCMVSRLATVMVQNEPRMVLVNPHLIGRALASAVMLGVELARRQNASVADLEQAWNAPEYGQLVPKPGADLGEGEWTGRGYDHA